MSILSDSFATGSELTGAHTDGSTGTELSELPARRRRLRSGLVGTIRLYQLARAGRPSPCRYVPSCSEYAAEAVENHGMVRGGTLALRRVARCHPWGGHGLDPVPGREGSR
jgi:putative membrane protein insertion efficiency factor